MKIVFMSSFQHLKRYFCCKNLVWKENGAEEEVHQGRLYANKSSEAKTLFYTICSYIIRGSVFLHFFCENVIA